MSNRKIPNAIPWRGSAAREILLRDLEAGFLGLRDDETSAEEAWEYVYKHLVEFDKVPFEQFKKQLQAHRLQVLRKVKMSGADFVRFRNTRNHIPAPQGLF